MGKNRIQVIEVEILDDKYQIKSRYNPEHVRAISDYVDTKMRELVIKSPKISLNKVALLTALDIADELFKEKIRQGLYQKK